MQQLNEIAKFSYKVVFYKNHNFQIKQSDMLNQIKISNSGQYVFFHLLTLILNQFTDDSKRKKTSGSVI